MNVLTNGVTQAFKTMPTKDPIRYAFLTLQNYTMIALASAMESLRMANRVNKQQTYEWFITTLDGISVNATCGTQLSPTIALGTLPKIDLLFVCGGYEVERYVSAEIIRALRRLAQQGVALGGICTGTFALAKAGLLDGYRAVIHWENMASLRELFPKVTFTDQIFAIDRNRYTCSGGIAPVDLMINILKNDSYGRDVSTVICEQFILERVRSDQDRQHIPLQARVGKFHTHLLEAASLMENHIEEPWSMDKIAQQIGVSRRQIERLFHRYVGQVPTKYYLDLRLQRARELLTQTSMPIVEVAVACGFQSSPHFSRCYRSLFGYSPSAERRLNHANVVIENPPTSLAVLS